MVKLYSDADFTRRFYNGAQFDHEHDAPSKDAARIIHSPSFRKLQGKMQLFPIGESDLLRTRLTHSLEVAEIATRIASRINRNKFFGDSNISLDVVAAASLAHDIGHPPFGHGGETALNACMIAYGGFEGNAQTLRVLAHLENRISRHSADFNIQSVDEQPHGLNLTYRTLASVVKYDRSVHYSDYEIDDFKQNLIIPKISKGYYQEEKSLLFDIKDKLLGPDFRSIQNSLYTIECQIMDIADDIAYSTYDLEDTIVAGISTPLDLCAVDDELMSEVTREVNIALERKYGFPKNSLKSSDVQAVIFGIFEQLMGLVDPSAYNMNNILHRAVYITRTYQENLQIRTHMFRRRLSESLINGAVDDIGVDINEKYPLLSKIKISTRKLLEIETLKALNFFRVIRSQRLMIAEERSKEIINTLFRKLFNSETSALIPHDLSRKLEKSKNDEQSHARLICDHIASMTDEEALELHDKMHSSRRTTIFGVKSVL